MVEQWWQHASQLPDFGYHPGQDRVPPITFTNGFEGHRNQEVEALLLQSMLRNKLDAPELHSILLLLVPLHCIPGVGVLCEEFWGLPSLAAARFAIGALA